MSDGGANEIRRGKVKRTYAPIPNARRYARWVVFCGRPDEIPGRWVVLAIPIPPGAQFSSLLSLVKNGAEKRLSGYFAKG